MVVPRDKKQEIYRLANEGVPAKVITAKIGVSYGAVESLIKRGRKKGIVTTYIRSPRHMPKHWKNNLRYFKLPVGSIHKVMEKMSPEVRAFWLDKAVVEEYPSLAETLADYLTEYYFELKHKEQSDE